MADFVRVAEATELPDPGKTLVEVDGDLIALFRVDGQFFAIDDVCTHDGGPLVEGELTDHKIACPRHGAKFDIRTGAALTMPALRGTRSHDVKIEEGGVWVRLRSDHATDGPSAHAAVAPTTHASGVLSGIASGQPSHASSRIAEAAAPPASSPSGNSSQSLSEELVYEMLKEVKDPELFVNIVDLGLIYGVMLSPAADAVDKQHVAIDMTMTSPACPAGPQLIADTKRAVGGHANVSAVEVRIVMDPPWTPDRMTDAARDQLGIF
ncbi:MAG: Rieske 2Fe-2S domain-containing protein [Planctomycetota bacterium]